MLEEVNNFISHLNWQGISAIFIATWFFNRSTRQTLESIEDRLDKLEARMFLLATGKSLEQAILEEKMKEKK